MCKQTGNLTGIPEGDSKETTSYHLNLPFAFHS